MVSVKNYEAIFILNPKAEKIDKIASSIADAIKNNKGQVLKEENWGKMKMAYPIKKKREGVYLKLNFTAEPSSIEKLEKLYKLNTDILRSLIIRR